MGVIIELKPDDARRKVPREAAKGHLGGNVLPLHAKQSLDDIAAHERRILRAMATHRRSGDLAGAFEAFSQSLILAGAEKDRVHEARRALFLESFPILSGMIYNELGMAFQTDRQFRYAIRAYEKAIAVEELAPPFHYNLGTAQLNLRWMRKALATYEHMIDYFPESHLSHLGMGVMMCERQDLAKAQDFLRHAIRIEPDEPEAHRILGELYYDIGEERGAKRHADRYRELEGSRPEDKDGAHERPAR